jgi:hypothetical protein
MKTENKNQIIDISVTASYDVMIVKAEIPRFRIVARRWKRVLDRALRHLFELGFVICSTGLSGPRKRAARKMRNEKGINSLKTHNPAKSVIR